MPFGDTEHRGKAIIQQPAMCIIIEREPDYLWNRHNLGHGALGHVHEVLHKDRVFVTPLLRR